MLLLLFQCKNSSLAADLKKKDEDRVEASQKVGRETHIVIINGKLLFSHRNRTAGRRGPQKAWV